MQKPIRPVVLRPANMPDAVVQQAVQMALDYLKTLPQGPARPGTWR